MPLRSYTVYDEDGAEFALKLFINDEDSDSNSEEEDASNSTSASSTYFIDAYSGWTPLYLSTVAGMPTCLGAAVVFCHPRSMSDAKGRDVGPGTMCFSLDLAGSVMVTVSVISIGPECLRRDVDDDDGGVGGGSGGGGWIRLLAGSWFSNSSLSGWDGELYGE